MQERRGDESQSELLSPLRALMATAQPRQPREGRVGAGPLPSVPSLCSRRPERAAFAGRRPRSQPCAPWRPQRRRPARAPRAPPPGPSPGARTPTPGSDPGRWPRAWAAGGGRRAGRGRPSGQRLPGRPRAPARSGRAGAESSSRPARGRSEVRGAARQSAAARGHGPGSAPRAARRHRCHPGLATPTFRTTAELEVSGLRGRWAGFRQRRLSLATKRESDRERGAETEGRRRRAGAQAPENLKVHPGAFLLVFILRGKHPPFPRAQLPWLRHPHP